MLRGLVVAAVLAALSACVQQPAPIGAQYRGTGGPQQPQVHSGYAAPWAAASFTGTYLDETGPLTLHQAPDGRITGTAVDGQLTSTVEGYVQNNQLVGAFVLATGRVDFTAVLEEPYIVVTIHGKPQRLVREGHGPPVAVVRTQPTAPALPAAADVWIPPAIVAVSASGLPLGDEIDGWVAKAPAKWNTPKQHLAENSEKTTKILVRYWRGLDIKSTFARLLKELGNAKLVGDGRVETLPGGNAVVVELEGTDSQRRWRVITIQGTEGTVEVLVFADANFEALRSTVDSVARTVKFVTPKRGKVELAGSCYRFFHVSFGTTVSKTLGLDGRGNAQWGGYVNVTNKYESMTGRDLGQTDTLLESDGDRGVYAIVGDQLVVHWNDGRVSRWHIRWNNGRVGMLVQDGDGYVKCS